jgi:hypothetical protein
MVTQTNDTTTAPGGLFTGLGRRLAAFAEWMIESSDLNRRTRIAQRYFAMSDEELARRGLRRDEIIHRIFGPRARV